MRLTRAERGYVFLKDDEGKLRLDLLRSRQAMDRAAQRLGYAVYRARKLGGDIPTDEYARVAAEVGNAEAEVERSFFAELRPSSLLKRFATVEEVANMVVYIVSEQAAATNGAALRVDGGVVRSIV